MIRSFVAIHLDAPLRSELVGLAARIKPACPGVRWAAEHHMHLTLKFLGDVPDADVPEVCAAAAQCARRQPTFTVNLAGCGCFPAHGRVRVIWVGIDSANGALMRCAEAIDRSMGDLGFAAERRRYSGHVTLGRVKDGTASGNIRRVVEGTPFGPQAQRVRAVFVMASELTASGPVYSVLAECPLAT